jgi:hypothetical protein
MQYRARRVEGPVPPELRERLEPSELLVLPGFADREVKGPASGEVVYPMGTGDFMKLLREGGGSIDYANPDQQRVTVALYAAEYWVPIIIMVRDLLVGVEGALLADVILEWTRGGRPVYESREHGEARELPESEATEPKDALLHVKIGAVDLSAGTIEWFEASGSRDDVLEGYREFRNR